MTRHKMDWDELQGWVRGVALYRKATDDRVEIMSDDGLYIFRRASDDDCEIRQRHVRARLRRAVATFPPNASKEMVADLLKMGREGILEQPLFCSYIEAFQADPDDGPDGEWWVCLTIDREDTGQEWKSRWTGLARDQAKLLEAALTRQAELLEKAQGVEDGFNATMGKVLAARAEAGE